MKGIGTNEFGAQPVSLQYESIEPGCVNPVTSSENITADQTFMGLQDINGGSFQNSFASIFEKLRLPPEPTDSTRFNFDNVNVNVNSPRLFKRLIVFPVTREDSDFSKAAIGA